MGQYASTQISSEFSQKIQIQAGLETLSRPTVTSMQSLRINSKSTGCQPCRIWHEISNSALFRLWADLFVPSS
jgi:hypothetical protein